MGLVHCPLCCQQEFDSVVALREHLLYYTYRPVMCHLCCMPFNGIANMIKHLEFHLVRPPMKSVETGSVAPNINDTMPPVEISSQMGESDTLSVGRTSLKEMSNDATPSGTNEVDTPETNENLSSVQRGLVIRAYTCTKCGTKVVGKDAYFTHLQNSCLPIDVATNENSEHSCDQEDSDYSDLYSSVESDISNGSLHSSIIEDLTPTNSLPYKHKKFDHDLERKEVSNEGKTHKYTNTLQSILVERLNQETLERKESVHSSAQSTLELSHTKRQYTCKHCPKTYSKSFLVVRHQNECHSSKTLHCKVCKMQCKSRRSLINHMGLHKEDGFACKVCNHKCKTASGLRTHVYEKHSKSRPGVSCTVCNQTFKKRYSLQRHLQRSHRPLNLQCDKCDKKFATNEDLMAHSHDSKECPVCHKKFSNHWGLVRHQKTSHVTNSTHECSLCTKRFKRKDVLLKHMQLHQKKHQCKTCSKTFLTQQLLKNHMTRHRPP